MLQPTRQCSKRIVTRKCTHRLWSEIDFFQDLAEELEANEPDFIDLRDRAGWSVDEKSKTPKMAALLADAQMDLNQQKSLDVISQGACFIFGEPEACYVQRKL